MRAVGAIINLARRRISVPLWLILPLLFVPLFTISRPQTINVAKIAHARLGNLQASFETSRGREHALNEWSMELGSLSLPEYTAELERAWIRLFGHGRTVGGKSYFDSRRSSSIAVNTHPIPWTTIASQLQLDIPASSDSIPHRVWTTSAKHPEDYPPQFKYWAENDPSLSYRHLNDTIIDEYLSAIYPSGTPMASLLSSLSDSKNRKRARVLKADIFRYTILFHRGGIYTDTDTALVKPFDEWAGGAEDVTDQVLTTIPYVAKNPSSLASIAISSGSSSSSLPQGGPPALIVSIEKSNSPSWRSQNMARGLQVVQWTIAARRGHPVFLDVLSKIVARWQQEQQGSEGRREPGGVMSSTDDGGVLDWTGPGPWSDAIFRYLLTRYGHDPRPLALSLSQPDRHPLRIGDVVILQQLSFQASASEKWSDLNTGGMCVWHGFEGAWKEEWDRDGTASGDGGGGGEGSGSGAAIVIGHGMARD
ncbi:hypothetical protein DL93DRAFT_2163145 [Clavulina sp. PMI_390]|nr:hypothetical protein DL93DRAFT_2163145 [Clavulina sp. PMI_390]